MDRSISLGVDVEASAKTIFTALSTTDGQRAFWTVDCDVAVDKARFGFPGAPMDLMVAVTTKAGELVKMTVTEGFPFWEGSTWEWVLGDPARSHSGTSVLFRHYGFGPGYSEVDLGHTAQTWALVLDRLAKYATSGKAQPFFPSAAPE